MTDPEFADATYIEPITPEVIEKILDKERPDAVLATLGGQTALNAAMALHERGSFEKFGSRLIGADVEAIKRGENREVFKRIVEIVGGESAKSKICHSMQDCLSAVNELKYPVVVRPSFTMGGLGSGIAGVPFRSARFALDVFASINKCNKTPEATRDIRNSEITIYEWNKCSTNVGMRYITVEGASHAWMGRTAVSSSAQSLVGTPYSNLDSTRAILSFLLGTAR